MKIMFRVQSNSVSEIWPLVQRSFSDIQECALLPNAEYRRSQLDARNEREFIATIIDLGSLELEETLSCLYTWNVLYHVYKDAPVPVLVNLEEDEEDD